MTLSPTYVDVSSGGVTVTLSVRVSDTSGVSVTNTPGAYIHPYANVLNDNKDFTNWSLVNGDEYDGTYKTKLFINPSNVPSATYTVVEELWMFDDPRWIISPRSYQCKSSSKEYLQNDLL